jgi:hypothetical protein
VNVDRVVRHAARGQRPESAREQALADALVEAGGDDGESSVAGPAGPVTPVVTRGATGHTQSGREVSR